MSRRTLEQYLNETDVAAFEGEHCAIGANAPILLNDSDDALLVLEGHVDVFVVEIKDGEPVGQRHSLFRATTGEILFGMPTTTEPTGGSELALMAVGVAGTKVIKDIAVDALVSLKPGHLAALLDRFIGGLLAAFPRTRPSASVTVVEAGQETEIYRNMPTFAATRRPLWISARPDQNILFYGEADLSATVLPTSSVVWIGCQDTMSVSGFNSETLIQSDHWRGIIIDFLRVYSELLRRTIQEMEAEAATRQKARQHVSQSALKTAILDMAATVRPEKAFSNKSPVTEDPLHSAFLEVARHLNIESTKSALRPARSRNAEAVDALALTYRLRTRPVILRDKWWHHDVGPLLAYTENERHPVALLPRPEGGYEIYDPSTGTRDRFNNSDADKFHGEAIMLYRPLSQTCRQLKGLIGFVMPTMKQDLRRVALMGLAGGLIAASVPVMTGVLIEQVLPRADIKQFQQIIFALIMVAFGGTSFEVVKAVALLRIEGRADLNLQSAMFDRLLRLPAAFFRNFTSGDLADRTLGIQTIRQTLTGTTVQSLLGVTFSLFSLALLFYYNWKLALVACALVIVAMSLTIWLGLKQLVHERQRIAHQGQAEGFVVQFLTGIAKLRVAAAESRAYARWAGYFTQQKRRFVQAQFFANQQDIFHSVFPVVATGLIFIMASVFLENDATNIQLEALVSTKEEDALTPMSTGDFIAFNTAFGQFLIAMTTLATALTRALAVVPMFERLRPVIEADLEVQVQDKAAETLRGGIEINHVDFRYGATGPLVLNDLTLSIEPNEFVAIVGPSGSGKSTLIRLLLGFERSEAGEVLFDGTPIGCLDMTSVRQQVRVVMQNSQLTTGSVFTNIVGNSTLTQDDAWYAAKLAGLDKEIEAMPMGMHTVLMEGVNTFSGGQRQRLMIARALVHRPSILLLDEPTSALDNKTQDVVMASLSRLNATRVIIAHRLSTVRAADRILVIEGGRLVQQGPYDELISTDGPFSEMAKRQLV